MSAHAPVFMLDHRSSKGCSGTSIFGTMFGEVRKNTLIRRTSPAFLEVSGGRQIPFVVDDRTAFFTLSHPLAGGWIVIRKTIGKPRLYREDHPADLARSGNRSFDPCRDLAEIRSSGKAAKRDADPLGGPEEAVLRGVKGGRGKTPTIWKHYDRAVSRSHPGDRRIASIPSGFFYNVHNER